MHRSIFLAIMLLLGAGLGALLYLKFTLPHEDSTVYLKETPNSPVSGYVTKKDNYIIVTKEGSEQAFPWAEVKSISGPKPAAPRSSAFGYWLDKLDFLSSLGVLAALVVFSVGLYQYQQGLLWKREEFLAGVTDSFSESPGVSNAKRMLESLAQYAGTRVELYPEKKDAGDSYAYLTNEEIVNSLAVPLIKSDDPEVEDRQIRVRQSFDTFLDYLEILDGYIRLRVVAQKSVHVQIGYWLDLLGRRDKLREDYRRRIVRYAEHFEYEGFLRIIDRYNKWHRLWWQLWVKAEPGRTVKGDGAAPQADGQADKGGNPSGGRTDGK